MFLGDVVQLTLEVWFSFVHTGDHGVGVVHHVDIIAGREEEAVMPGLVISESRR